MGTRRLILLVALALSAYAPKTQAEVEIVQTGFQRISDDPPLVRVEFYVLNQDAFGFRVCDMSAFPMGEPPYGACAVGGCESPDGFSCIANGATANWFITSEDACIAPGEQMGPFTILHGDEMCCYTIGFMSPVLEWYTVIPFCFETDQVVQNRSVTWGRIKVLYR